MCVVGILLKKKLPNHMKNHACVLQSAKAEAQTEASEGRAPLCACSPLALPRASAPQGAAASGSGGSGGWSSSSGPDPAGEGCPQRSAAATATCPGSCRSCDAPQPRGPTSAPCSRGGADWSWGPQQHPRAGGGCRLVVEPHSSTLEQDRGADWSWGPTAVT